MTAFIRTCPSHRLRRMIAIAVGLVTAIPMTVGAFAATAGAQRVTRPSDGRRFRADSFWVRTWLRGAKEEPELFVEPRHVSVAGDVVTVLDLGTREVVAFDQQSGRTRFTLAARGEGPGEFKRPARLVSDGQRFGVLDHATARLTMFEPRGVLSWDAPVNDAANVESACVLSGGRVLIKVAGAATAVRLVDSTGRMIAQHSIPTDDPDNPPPAFATSAHMSGPFARDRCALVPSYGRTWYTIDARGTMIAHPYIEPGADAVVRVARKTIDKNWRSEMRSEAQTSTVSPIARGALHIGDTLVVQAGATRRSPHTLLDYYLIPSGRYLYTRRLPTAFTALGVAADGTYFGAVIGDEVSWVLGMKPAGNAPKTR